MTTATSTAEDTAPALLLRTPGGIGVPAAAARWRFSRATGPGGQGVNTTDSRVELVVDLTRLEAPDGVRQRVCAALGESVRIVATERRSQLRNREAALVRLIERLDHAARPRRVRRASRPTAASVERRLESKRRAATRKAARRRPPAGD